MRRVPLGNTHYFKFTTRNFSTGAPYTLAGTPVISIYEENNLTQITAGVTLTADYDTVTGLNSVAVAATGANGYSVGKTYAAVITTGTVNSVSVVGEVVDQFEIVPAENVAGYPVVDSAYWAGSATATNDTALATAPTNFADLAITATTGLVDINTKTGFSLAASQSFSTTGSVGSVTGAVGSVTSGVTVTTNNDKTGYSISGTKTTLDALNDITAASVWDITAASHITSGTVGAALALGSAAIIDITITGTPTSTSFTFSGGNTNNNFYNDQLLYILSGTGVGQGRPVLSSTYSGGTTTITVDEAFIVTPAAGDRVAIVVDHTHPITQIRDEILADATAFNGADISTILTDTGTTLPNLIGTPSVDISTDIASVKTDTGTTIPGLIGTPTVDISTDLANRTPTAAQLAYIVENAATGKPVTFSGTGTTTTATLALVDGVTPSSTTDQYKGRLLVFNAGTLDEVVTDITAYDGATKVVTVTAVPVAITSAHTARLI
jgi:hypothetical protein